jgi:hypothetical protein
MTKGIFIDVENRKIEEVLLDTSNEPQYQVIQRLVGGLMEYLPIQIKGNDLIINEEGRYMFEKGFRIKGWNDKLYGSGLLLGFDDTTGDNIDTTLSVDEVTELVEFTDVKIGEGDFVQVFSF